MSIDDRLTETQPLVHYHAGKLVRLMPQCMVFNDLVQAGYEGVIKADRDYDASSKASFKTYASYRIHGAMFDEIRRNQWFGRKQFAPVYPYTDLPTSDIPPDGDTGDYIFDRVYEERVFSQAQQHMDTLPDRERQVLRQYYLNDERLKVIGQSLGIHESRACQIRNKAIAKLKRRIVTDNVDAVRLDHKKRRIRNDH